MLPPQLRTFFGLEAIEARWLGLKELDGVPLAPTDLVVPRCCTLPMGFAWSLYFAQRAHEHVLETGSSLFGEERRLRDRTPNADRVGQDPYHLQYVDNLGIFGTDLKRVNNMKDVGKALMDKVGLAMHEHEDATGHDVEILGHVVRPEPPEIRLKAARAWKLRAAAQHLLRRRVVCGRVVEVIVGHSTYAFLLNRSLLSVFAATYKFIRSAYVVAEKLWPSVRRELEMAMGLLPMAAVCLSRVWDSDVWVTDAAPHGLGVCKSTWCSRSVVEIGRVAERWRFRMGATNARELELGEDPVLLAQLSPDWRPVPGRLMSAEKWGTIHSQQIECTEPIHVKEGWAIIWVLQHLSRAQRNHSRKHLFLNDNMSLVLSLSKGRGQSESMNNIC